MKTITFKTSPFNPIVYVDLSNYMGSTGERISSAPTRHYMQHRNQTGYTRIRQTKTQIIVEWME
ncbi:hypothetical protein JLT2_52 [Paraglaciecola Antarctic JLT virus 2]|nr:hypothetical protein JLT2_52 [Paraglaciecola Antarctic JLT virus 2]